MGQQNCGCGPCDKVEEDGSDGKVDQIGRSGYALDKAAEETIFEPIGTRGRGQVDPSLVDAVATSSKEARSVLRKAWGKLKGEFGVQVNIWGSLAMGSRGQGDTKKKEREIAKSSLEASLQQCETKPLEAAATLEELLSGPAASVLNNASLAAAKQIQLIAAQTTRREELAKLLNQKDLAVKTPTPLQLEQLVEDCGFEDGKLEARVRAVLDLSDHTRVAEQ